MNDKLRQLIYFSTILTLNLVVIYIKSFCTKFYSLPLTIAALDALFVGGAKLLKDALSEFLLLLHSELVDIVDEWAIATEEADKIKINAINSKTAE